MRKLVRRYVSAWLLLVLLAACISAYADEELPAQYGDRPKNADRVKDIHEANLARYKGVADVLVLPGLVARRKEKRVEIMAESTGLGDGTVIEFLLIDQGSGKGYEALLWSFAKPSDVHKALMFIGMAPGEPFNPAKLRFWSKGERVLLSVAAEDNGREDVPPKRLESLVLDKTREETLPAAGFVFAGSFMADNRGEKPGRVYAADVFEPRSVASLYNDPTAVLDVPRRARRSDVYGSLVVGPEYDFAKNELLSIVLEPEYKDGRKRVKDLVLNVRRSEVKGRKGGGLGETSGPASAMEFLLTDKAGKAMSEKPELPAVLGVFDSLIRGGQDPYVSVRFDAALRLADVRKVCRVIALIDTDSGIRVEPPAPGQLYYEAFLPGAQWLDREGRIIQPWELRLARKNGKVSGTLTLYESVWEGDGSAAKLKVTTFDVKTPQSLRDRLDADAARRKEAGRRPGAPVLLVFADANLTYGKLMDFISPAFTTHNIVHVFLEPEADGKPKQPK